jgi:hypothetical protein
LLETLWHRSWLPQRFPLVYVEYLASAPWNRRSLEDPPYLDWGRTGTRTLCPSAQCGVRLRWSRRSTCATRRGSFLSTLQYAGLRP